MKVAKFGGTSLANAAQIRKVCDIILADPDRRLVVVSAPGKRCPEDTKVTDLLIHCAQEYQAHGKTGPAFDKTLARFTEIVRELGLPGDVVEGIRENLRHRLESDRSHEPRYVDVLK